ncbi:NAD(P)(+)--arginine ADP-ribosyltransferase 1-like [Sinocyclocheilus grahami]|uniref:NAD(P)(+)--arginine ADP-ribosyltransferase 1-like n=1 Tax=Sinocyclocheilus grahami TaxID=75366 RepID=UPI0007ACC6DC|nr:PREDICTED: NAD(P)(+)--arginine ADP-ribosyltransferase 1-like [Sinocyclocheilus grahami]
MLLQDHRAAAARKIYPLDMALNSVDDQFKGCRKKMSNHVRTNYLKKELNNSIDFRNAWKHAEKNVTLMTYKWYSLYFLLTDAIQILKKQQNKCYLTYRGTNVTFNDHDFTGVRFGSFTSSSVNDSRAHSFGNVSCFEIQTCEAALGQDHRLAAAVEKIFPLDIPNSADDQYEGCTNEMAAKVEKYYREGKIWIS